jgi:hypothetical protein
MIVTIFGNFFYFFSFSGDVFFFLKKREFVRFLNTFRKMAKIRHQKNHLFAMRKTKYCQKQFCRKIKINADYIT